MTNRLDEILTQIAALRPEDRDLLLRMLPGRAEVRDGESARYGSEPPEGKSGMKSVIVTLPDDLATEAQAAGLLGAKRIEELIRRELRGQPAPAPQSSQRRRLVRHEGRLVVEALPDEERIDTAEVRDLLNRLEW